MSRFSSSSIWPSGTRLQSCAGHGLSAHQDSRSPCTRQPCGCPRRYGARQNGPEGAPRRRQGRGPTPTLVRGNSSARLPHSRGNWLMESGRIQRVGQIARRHRPPEPLGQASFQHTRLRSRTGDLAGASCWRAARSKRVASTRRVGAVVHSNSSGWPAGPVTRGGSGAASLRPGQEARSFRAGARVPAFCALSDTAPATSPPATSPPTTRSRPR